MVDAHSRWPKALMMLRGTNAQRTIGPLKSVFARNGLCDEFVSYNGPPCLSKEVNEFLHSSDINSTFSMNGEAERFPAALIKQGLKRRHLLLEIEFWLGITVMWVNQASEVVWS